ncbi:Lsr2 family protein [Streptomyces xanthochromogenes]|uniref:histone-like nucleoid-structuring protein Lsr2 n=1 Tax=Streptomyces xanthochromogenes TaxID=67384 RepID=UPI0037F75C59
MAQKTVVIYTDDLTGEESAEAATHSIIIDGVAYEVDLGPDSYDKLMEAVNPFLRAGRRVRGGRAKTTPTRQAGGNNDTAAIRAWAKEKGYDINDRGRVPAEIREAYDKTH